MLEDVLLRALGVVGVSGLVWESVRKFRAGGWPKKTVAAVITYRRRAIDDDDDEESTESRHPTAAAK